MWQLFNPERLPLKTWGWGMKMYSVSYSLYGFKRQSWNILLPDWNLPSLLNWYYSVSRSWINASDQTCIQGFVAYIGKGWRREDSSYLQSPSLRKYVGAEQLRGRIPAVSTWPKRAVERTQGCEYADGESFICVETKHCRQTPESQVLQHVDGENPIR